MTKVRLRGIVAGLVRGLPDLPVALRGLPTALNVLPFSPGTMGAWLDRNARRWPDRPGILYEGQRWTWAEVAATVDRMAGALRGAGVRRGQVVGILAPSGPAVLFAVGAIARLGATAALIPPDQRGEVLRHSLTVCGARRVLLDRRLDPVWRSAEVPIADGRVLDLDALLHGDAPPVGRQPWIRTRSPLLTIFTSGTTGMPKAALMSHQRWRRASAAYGRMLLGLTSADVLYVPLPLHHHMGLTVGWGSCVATGAALALRAGFSASAFWQDCVDVGATAMVYIGEVPRYLLDRPAGPADRAHRVRTAVGVGMRPELWGPFQERFGVPRVRETYGASESNLLFVNPFGVPGSVGFTIAPYMLARFDPDTGALWRGADGRGARVERGEPGLLLGRLNAFVPFEGYTDAGATAGKVRRDVRESGDAWFDTGDVLQDVGWWHLAFVDRMGDTYRWKSENVSTRQVEAAVDGGPGVVESVVVGVEVAGQPGRAGLAAVVVEAGFDVDRLAAHLDRVLPRPAVPVFVRVTPALARTRTFKHKKGPIRDAGFDPGRTSDPVYVLPRRPAKAVRVDAEVYADIQSGRLML